MKTVSFDLKPIPPFRLDLTAWALRRRKENLIDRWDGFAYRRVLMLGSNPAEVEIIQDGPPERPRLRVTMTARGGAPESKTSLKALLTRMLGLRIDLAPFYAFAAGQKKIAALVQKFRGLKPPCFPSVYEALVNGVACQQLSLTVGIILLNRLAKRYGVSFTRRGETVYSFARPEELGRSTQAGLRHLGFSRQKGLALRELSRLVLQKKVDLEPLRNYGDEAVLEMLNSLRGIGRWTGEYVLLRGLGRIHVFPGDDVGARNKLQRLLDVRKPLDYEGVRRIRERWMPYGGLIYFHLLLDSLAAEGHLPA